MRNIKDKTNTWRKLLIVSYHSGLVGSLLGYNKPGLDLLQYYDVM